MDAEDEVLMIALTRDEATEVFLRCLRSQDEDTNVSTTALQKLARLIGFESGCRVAA